MWTKVSKEVLDKAQYIVPLKKGELQIKYAEALVKIDKAIEYIEKNTNEIEGITGYYYTISDTEELLDILKEVE